MAGVAAAVVAIGGAVLARPVQTQATAGSSAELQIPSVPLGQDDAPQSGAAPAATAAGPAVTVLAAGDIAACGDPGAGQTAALIAAHPGAPVLALGDLAYSDGAAYDFANCFDPYWGPFKSRIRPVPGNHEYHTANAQPYYDYFGAIAGPSTDAASRGYYSFDLGAWHIVALNSEQDAGAAGTQLAWLRRDLAANQRTCVLAFWHRPRFVTSTQYTDLTDVQPFWDALYAAGAEVVLNGHDHTYQRFGPLSPSGQPDSAGIREFVVGTGGRPPYDLRPDARREAAFGDLGLLQLTLADNSYDWKFLPVAGHSQTDSGSGLCH